MMEDYEGFKLFFKAVELWINQEIDIENSQLGINPICGAKSNPPERFPWNSQLEINFGPNRICSVTLSSLGSAIEVEIHDEGPGEPQSRRQARFRLENLKSGVTAFMIDSANGEPAEREVGPKEIAQEVVAGVVRGHFG
jgi:hypothetical protein